MLLVDVAARCGVVANCLHAPAYCLYSSAVAYTYNLHLQLQRYSSRIVSERYWLLPKEQAPVVVG